MVSTESQKPLCPVCHQADQVQTLQAAYKSGIKRFEPPPLPVGRVPMMNYMVIGVGVITLCSFFVIVLLGPNLPDYVRWIQAGLTITLIVIVLGLSLLAFIRAVQGDLQSQKLLPGWDRAMANWGRLRYCKRDNVVFDPQQPSYKPLSDREVDDLVSVEATAEHADEASARIAQRASN